MPIENTKFTYVDLPCRIAALWRETGPTGNVVQSI